MVTRKYYKKKRGYTKRRFIKKIRRKNGGTGTGEPITTNQKYTKDIKENLMKELEHMKSQYKLTDKDYDRIKQIIEETKIFTQLNNYKDGAVKYFKSLIEPSDNKNKMNIQLLIRPNTSKLYNKQGSKASQLYESGDFIVNITNKDASWLEHIQNKITSTDSLLANILNRCNDWTCLSTDQTGPPLIAEQNIKIIDDRSAAKESKEQTDQKQQKEKEQQSNVASAAPAGAPEEH
jgi:hypothetical protein